MEKIVTSRSFKEFRERENPWKNRSYLERLAAVAEISGTTDRDGGIEREFYRVYRVTRSEPNKAG